MFIFRRFMAERSIAYVVGCLTIVGTLLSLPIVGMYYHDLKIPADYSHLGELLVAQMLLGIALPFGAILAVRALRLRWA